MHKFESMVPAATALPDTDPKPHSSLIPNTSYTSSQTQNVWSSFQQWLTVLNEDESFWWKTTGSHMATLMGTAGYTVNEQCEALLFHSQLVIPSLGPKPVPDSPRWKSFMTDDFSPIEYSWKWGYGSSAPEIRYGIEAIGQYTGTAIDKRNQLQTHELLYNLSQALPSVNLAWYRLFVKELFGSDISPEEMIAQSSLFLAFEMIRGKLGVKAYFIPQEKPDESCSQQILRAVRVACGERCSAVDSVFEYLADEKSSASLAPFMVGIDCVEPEESRIKIYVRSQKTSFDFVSNVMTIGGRRQGLEQPLDEFHQLWKLTLSLGEDHTSDKELPRFRHQTSGTCFYFDVKPKAPMADVKAYIPVRHYANSDEQVAEGLRHFLAQQNRDKFFAGYKYSVEQLTRPGDVPARCGVQTYISCAFDKGRVSMTSYLSPQVYRPEPSSPAATAQDRKPLEGKKWPGRVRIADW